MPVPAHIRFTLAEMASLMAVATPVLDRIGSAIHLVLTEGQETLPSTSMRAVCSIISVEDADGITVAVLKHPEGQTWARVKEEQTARTAPEGLAHVQRLFREADIGGLRGTAGSTILVDEHEPLVPRREPEEPNSDRFQRGVKAILEILRCSMDSGALRRFDIEHSLCQAGYDNVIVDGQISLRALAKAFLDAYRPQITISDQVRFGQGKAAMKRVLYRGWKDDSIHFLGPLHDGETEEQVGGWPDLIHIEGTVDIDALAKAFWSVMKGGEGQ